jgi:ATP-dependent Clp protease ATP-binding subunit ClpC
MVARVEGQLANKDMSLEITQDAKKLLAHRGFDPVLGARPLRRTIQREIEDALSEKILYGELTAGQIIVVDVEGEGADQRFTFRGEAKPIDVPDTPPVALSGGDEEGPAAQAE